MDYSDAYDPDRDFDRWYTEGAAEVIAAFIRRGDHVVELGCGTGLMTTRLVAAGATVLAIDRADTYLARARARELPGVEWVHADLDRWQPDGRAAQHVVATSVLHEVDDPVRLLQTASSLVGPGGMVHISLQNPRSIHRMVAYAMGELDSLTELSSRGRAFGTRAIWDVGEVLQMAARARLRCAFRRGVFLKPLANEDMARLPDNVLRGFLDVAADFPDFCAMNYFLLVPEP